MVDIGFWNTRRMRRIINNDAKAKLKLEDFLAEYKSSITSEEAIGQLESLNDMIANGPFIESYSGPEYEVIIDEAHRSVFYSDEVFPIDEEFNWEEVFEKEKVSGSFVIDEAKRIQRILYDIYTENSSLLSLNCWEFEEIVAELLIKQGFKVELTQKTKDNGYDIIALLNVNKHNPLKFLVECKRYTNRKVGVDVIRSFKEVINTEYANRGIIVTTSYFTKGALEKQRETPYLLDYRDKDKVIEWVRDYFDSFSNEMEYFPPLSDSDGMCPADMFYNEKGRTIG